MGDRLKIILHFMDSLILSQATQLYQDLKMPVRNLPLCDRWIFDILMHNRRKTFCGFARLLITSLNLILSVVKGSFVRQDWIYCHWFWHWNFFLSLLLFTKYYFRCYYADINQLITWYEPAWNFAFYFRTSLTIDL